MMWHPWGPLWWGQHGSESRDIGVGHGHLTGAPLPGRGLVLVPRKEMGTDRAPGLYFDWLKVI